MEEGNTFGYCFLGTCGLMILGWFSVVAVYPISYNHVMKNKGDQTIASQDAARLESLIYTVAFFVLACMTACVLLAIVSR